MGVSDGRQPVGVARVPSVDDREEQLLEPRRDRTRPAGPDAPAVQLADRRDLDRRSGEERLVREVHLVPRETLLADRDDEIDIFVETDEGDGGE